MEGMSARGVLSHLSLLEEERRSRNSQQQSRVKELKAEAEALRVQRDQLKAEIETHKSLQLMRVSMDQQGADQDNEEEMDENSQLLRLMARHTQLNDLLHAHHIIGGFDVVKTRQRKGVCVSLATVYGGVFLEKYNLEIDLKPKLRIGRHNIPPFIPLNRLAEQSNMQTNLRAFLEVLSQHLNAYVGRRRQLELVKELHQSVEVMESNILCSMLVLMFIVLGEETAVLCTLDYADHTRCLPTRVHVESEDKILHDSPEWKINSSLLMQTPLHEALATMRKMRIIV